MANLTTTFAGIMVRESRWADAPFLACGMSPGIGIFALCRNVPGDALRRTAVIPYGGSPWFRIRRQDVRYDAEYSLDGQMWLRLATEELLLPGPMQAGLALTGGSATAYGGAVFRDVQVVDAVGTQPTTSELTLPEPTIPIKAP